MSNVAKLKKQAAELEQKKQFDKALAIYIKLLDGFDEHADELDVALFNRTGDLMLRLGNVADAVDYYERAIDRYSETGFFNNAIALCNKVLRHSPGRASVYYKLGKISAQKGFKGDAKVNFLEYADRMQKAGKVDEAFRALKEFADLCPDQDEIRLMLADQLTKADRKDEGIEQLQILYSRYQSEGRITEANATAERIRALDASVELKTDGGARRKSSSSDLVFLDLDTPSPRESGAVPSVPTPAQSAPAARAATPAHAPAAPERPAPPRTPTPAAPTPVASTPVDDLPIIEPATRADIALTGTPGTAMESPLSGITRISDDVSPSEPTPSGSLLGLESTHLADDSLATNTPSGSLLDLEPTSLGIEPTTANSGTPTFVRDAADTLGIERTSLTPEAFPSVQEASVSEPTPVFPSTIQTPPPIHRSSAPTHDSERDTPASGELEFILPEPDEEPIAPPEPSIDFDLSELATPAATLPPAPRPPRSAPRTTNSALDGLPLMDLETPASSDAVPPAPTPEPSVPNAERHTSSELTFITDDIDLALPAEEAAEAPIEAPVERPLDDALDRALDGAFEAAQDGALDQPNDGLLDQQFDAALEATPETASEATSEEQGIDLNAESLTLDDDEGVNFPTPSIARRSTMVALHSVEILQASVEGEPQNWSLRRELAEAMLEAGDRENGIKELETAMSGAEQAGDLDLAASLADEIARLEPDSVRHHQKRVEYAYRSNDRPRLIDAYLSLGDALLRGDQPDKARSIYQRVIELAPDELRALAALEAIEPAPAEPAPTPPRRSSSQGRAAIPAAEPAPRPLGSENGFVNLGDWLRDDAAPKDTRMVVAEQEPTGDEEADFADMLRKFKQGVAENVDPEDYQSHYDLAIAYKEMGLLDEAIAEFQKALANPVNRLPTFEALGQCFLDKGLPKLATSILTRALNEQAAEEQLVGVLYLLGRAAEDQGNHADALNYYQRVFVLDIQFRDIVDRMTDVERAAR